MNGNNMGKRTKQSGKAKKNIKIKKNILKNDFRFKLFQNNMATGKRGLSFMSKILGVILIPAIIISVIITIYAIVTLQIALGGSAKDGLESIAKCVAAGYNTADESNYYVSNNDHLFKGFYDVTGREDVIDSYAADEDLDVSIYYGSICKATSMKDPSTGERLLEMEAPADVVSTVIDQGKVYNANNVKMNGHNYSVVYIPIVEDEAVVGMVCAARYQNTVYKDVNRNRIGFIICEIVMILLVALASFTFAYRISKFISFTGSAIDTMASGDLTFEIEKKYLNRKDEIGNMLNQLDGLRNRFVDVISGVVKSANTMYSASEEVGTMTSQTGRAMDDISNAVTEISNSAMGQADEVEVANMSMITLGGQVDDISEGVRSLDASADNMKTASDKVIAIMDELSETTARTTDAIANIGKQVMMTNKSVEEIKVAVAMITEIASETNLLSLNASIEAARAGESGRGFAVVASEIQKLSDQSNDSAVAIGDIISELGRKSEDTVREMHVVEDIIKEQQEKLNETKEKFAAVESEIDSSRNETLGIKESTDVCNESKVKIVEVMSNLSALSEQNAAATEETTASIEEINANVNVLAASAVKVNKLAEELVEAVKYFKLEN